MKIPAPPPDDFEYWNGEQNIHGDRREILRRILQATRGNPNALQQRALIDEYEALKDPAYQAALAAYEAETDEATKKALGDKVEALFDAAVLRWRDQATPEQFDDMYDAAEKIVNLVRDVFKMAPYSTANGSGANEGLCWKIWYAFRESCHEDKKKRATLPTGSPPTAPLPATSQPLPNTSV